MEHLRPTWWTRFARATVRAIFRILFRIRLEGEPPLTGPYLLVANHQGWADAFLVLALWPPRQRVVFLADHAATMTQWWKRMLLRSLGVIVTIERRARSDRSAIEGSLDLLRSGAILGIFPEGRVSHAESQLASFRRGVGYLAMKAGVPVVPVWLRGTAELYLGRELVAKIGTARVPPTGDAQKDETEAFAAQLHRDLAAMSEPRSASPVGPKRLRWLTNLF